MALLVSPQSKALSLSINKDATLPDFATTSSRSEFSLGVCESYRVRAEESCGVPMRLQKLGFGLYMSMNASYLFKHPNIEPLGDVLQTRRRTHISPT
jgi:hypothetical protein